MGDNDHASQTDTPWHEHLSQGELRRLAQHLEAAAERGHKAYKILGESGAIEDWDGDYGFMHGATEGYGQLSDAAIGARKQYEARRGESDE